MDWVFQGLSIVCFLFSTVFFSSIVSFGIEGDLELPKFLGICWDCLFQVNFGVREK